MAETLTAEDVLLVDMDTPEEPVALVWLDDPALDQEALNRQPKQGLSLRAQYLATRDIGVLPVRAGKKPARFMVRVPDATEADRCSTVALARAEIDSIDAAPGRAFVPVSMQAAMAHNDLLAFERFVVEVKDLVRRKTDGTIVREDVKGDELKTLSRTMRRAIGKQVRKLYEPPTDPPPEADTGKSPSPS